MTLEELAKLFPWLYSRIERETPDTERVLLLWKDKRLKPRVATMGDVPVLVVWCLNDEGGYNYSSARYSNFFGEDVVRCEDPLTLVARITELFREKGWWQDD